MHVGDGVAKACATDAAKTKQRSGIARGARAEAAANNSASVARQRRVAGARGRFAIWARARITMIFAEKEKDKDNKTDKK